MNDEEFKSKKQEELSIKSPVENIAQKQVLAVEDANVKIKGLIIEGLKNGVDLKVLNKEILEIIESNGIALKSYPALYETYTTSMKVSTKRWFRYYTENLKNINAYALKQFKNVGIAINDINAMYNNTNQFRPYVSNNSKGLAIIKDYEQLLKKEITRLVNDNPIATIVDKNGKVRKRSLRNEAETKVRLQANKEDVSNLKDKGTKFVMTTSHADCSKRCQPWQGKLYSLDGTSGVYNGMKYIPLEKAMEGANGDGNGIISGYNCRHRAVKYNKGMIAPKEYSQAYIRRERELDKKQRYYERSIRQDKVRESLLQKGGYIEDAKKIANRIKGKENIYKSFSLRNERAFYQWRTEVIADKE